MFLSLWRNIEIFILFISIKYFAWLHLNSDQNIRARQPQPGGLQKPLRHSCSLLKPPNKHNCLPRGWEKSLNKMHIYQISIQYQPYSAASTILTQHVPISEMRLFVCNHSKPCATAFTPSNMMKSRLPAPERIHKGN